MNDFLGKELKVDDQVVFLDGGRSPEYVKGIVKDFKGTFAVIAVSSGHTYRKSSHKIIKVKHNAIS